MYFFCEKDNHQKCIPIQEMVKKKYLSDKLKRYRWLTWGPKFVNVFFVPWAPVTYSFRTLISHSAG